MAYQVNTKEIIDMMRAGKNPQQIMLNILENNMANTPFGANLLFLARNNRTKEIEQIARNLCKSKGLDYDKEFMAFRQQWGL